MTQKVKAFTLIELLVIITIIGMLSSTSIATFHGYIEKAKIAKGQAAARILENTFLAENALNGGNVFTGKYSFEGSNALRAIDNSGTGNDLIFVRGFPPADIVRSSDTPSGTGKSLEMTGAVRLVVPSENFANKPENKVTFSFWFKFKDNVASTRPIVNIVYDNENTTGLMHFSDTMSFFNQESISAPNIIKNNWYHIIASYNGDIMRLWINGELIGTKTGVINNMLFDDEQLLLFNKDGMITLIDDLLISPYGFDGENLE